MVFWEFEAPPPRLVNNKLPFVLANQPQAKLMVCCTALLTWQDETDCARSFITHLEVFVVPSDVCLEEFYK